MTRRDEIFEVLCDYADAHIGNSPSIDDLLTELRKRGYTISRSTLREHLLKLQVDRRIERMDGKLIIIGADWLSPDEVGNSPATA